MFRQKILNLTFKENFIYYTLFHVIIYQNLKEQKHMK